MILDWRTGVRPNLRCVAVATPALSCYSIFDRHFVMQFSSPHTFH